MPQDLDLDIYMENLECDMDNIIKIIADALNQIAYKDDSQIVDTTIQKYYSDNPRVIVMIKEAEFTWQT